MSYCVSLQHIIIGTKGRQRTMPQEHKRELYAYIKGIVDNRNCSLLRINGIEDHLHMLVNLHSTVCLADLMRDIKRGCSKWLSEMKRNEFPHWSGCGSEYAAFSISPTVKERVIAYIDNQESHHKSKSAQDELRSIVEQSGLSFYQKEDEL